MQERLDHNRTMRVIGDDRAQRLREEKVHMIMNSFGYDYDNACKVLELQRVQTVEVLFGVACGSFAAFKMSKIQRELERSFAIMRKTWMRYPLLLFSFGFAYHLSNLVPTKLLMRFSKDYRGIEIENYRQSTDLVGRFRLFDNVETSSQEDQILDYLSTYSKNPLTKAELLDHMMKKIQNETDLSQIFQVRRLGKDQNDIFYALGKVHGLENIAFVDPERLKNEVKGNPVRLQRLIDEVDSSAGFQMSSYDQLHTRLDKTTQEYKDCVNKMPLQPSDRKKLLALPFFLSKRAEKVEPQIGQPEMELFEQLTGRDYFEDATDVLDREEKITEFNYEDFLNPELLKGIDTESDDFKLFIKTLNFYSKTRLEKHEQDKEIFRELMPMLAGLTPAEQKALVHKVRNDQCQLGQEQAYELMEQTVSKFDEIQMAKISEAETHLAKNRYRLHNKRLMFADKQRMPVDKQKVKDMLQNQAIFRQKIESEVNTYTALEENPQEENGLLAYINETAYGDMRDLITEVGIQSETIPFVNLAEFRRIQSDKVHDSDEQLKYLMNGMFTPVDMTDHEEGFTGFNEIAGALPINRANWMLNIEDEPYPQTDAKTTLEDHESLPLSGTGPTMKGLLTDFHTESEPEEPTHYGAEDDEGDEDYDEEGEGDEDGGEEDYGDYDEEEEFDPEDDMITPAVMENRFFRAHDTLRDKYSDVEIENFMKLLNVSPHKQWQDQHTHHYKMGVHNYEDENQELDYDFHVLSEVDRKEADRIMTKNFRKGTEVKFNASGKKILYPNLRF